MRSLIINYDLEDDFAIIAPVKRCNLGRLNHLLTFLYQEWSANNYQLSAKCYLAMERAAILFPRLDTKGLGFNVKWLNPESLEVLFIGEVEGNKLLPCKLMQIHEFEVKSGRKPKKPGESLTPEDIPIPSSGIIEADILASLIAIDDSVNGAIALYENLDAQMINAVIAHLNEMRKDPKDRLNEYLNQQFADWKRDNQQEYRKAIFG